MIFEGLVRDLNPGPLAPEARIIPLDQAADDVLGNQLLGPSTPCALFKNQHTQRRAQSAVV